MRKLLLFTVPAVATTLGITDFGWRDALAIFLLSLAADQMTIPALAVKWKLCFEILAATIQLAIHERIEKPIMAALIVTR
jgi:hypothetical protein